MAPHTDSIFIRQFREHLDSVRKAEHRPIIAIVFSGGGAKGAAQVGAMKYIEEIGMPVDLICGTSIGGLLGGMYAIGYDSSDMEYLFRNSDWNKMLSDRIDPAFIPYSSKMFNAEYALAVPFHYDDRAFESRVLDQEKYGTGEIEFKSGDQTMLSTREGVNSLLSSLPSGFAYGFNVNNLIASLTVGYQDSISFRDLPIPFMCVASDMISCKAKNWGSGSLRTALRSTMSIPGLYDPVRTEGMQLVDGGTRNNFPTDVARACGADYIIGIELSDLDPGYSQVNNIGNIVSQFIKMLGKDAYDKNVNTPDIFIKPEISEFNMLSFSPEAVDTMVRRGYEAAIAKSEELLAIKAKTGNYGWHLNRRKATDISKTPVQLASIEFDGLSDEESRLLVRRIGLKAGDVVDKTIIDDAMSKVQATEAFESVTYNLYGTGNPYRLVFHCSAAPTNRMSFGGRIDTEEWASLLFNVGLNTHRLTGSKLDFTAKLGQNLKADLRYTLALSWMPALNFSASVARYKGNIGSNDDQIKYDVSYWTHQEMLYLTDLKWTRFNFRAGLKNVYYNLDDDTVFGASIAELSPDAIKTDYLGAFAKGNIYTFDNFYYPSKGVNFAFCADYDFARFKHTGYTAVLSLGFDFKAVIPLYKRLALVPDLHVRNIFNPNEQDVSLLHSNFIGGAIAGRYTENQVPFFGFNNVMMADDNLFTATLGLRYNPWKNIYFTGMGGLVESQPNLLDALVDLNPDTYAIGFEAAYNFITGPVKFNVHWSNTLGWGMYMSFGFDF